MKDEKYVMRIEASTFPRKVNYKVYHLPRGILSRETDVDGFGKLRLYHRTRRKRKRAHIGVTQSARSLNGSTGRNEFLLT
jgi:hypothetical protein